MAFYCELPNERICDIGWERLTCTEQWLEEQIREIRGYSREQRVELGTNSFQNIAQFCMKNYPDSQEIALETLGNLGVFASGIACLGRSSVTQAWTDEVTEMTSLKPEVLESVVQPFMNGNQISYRQVVVDMAMFGASIGQPIGAVYLRFCICIACVDMPNEAAFNKLREIYPDYLLLRDRWDYALRTAGIGGDNSEMDVIDDYQDEKPVLPLREYRRQQRATEREKKRTELENEQEKVNARKQREKDAEEAYDTALKQWEQQCATIERKRSELCKQRIKEEEKRLRDQANQRRERKSRELSRRLAEQKAVKKEAEQTLAELSVFKLAEKNRQKKIIQEIVTVIEAAKAAQIEADAVYKRDLEESERLLTKLSSRFAEEAVRTFPMPEKPQMSPDVARRKAVGKYEHLCDWLISHFGNEEFRLVDAANKLNQTGDVNRIPFLNVTGGAISTQELAYFLLELEKSGVAEKRTDFKTRTIWYRIR